MRRRIFLISFLVSLPFWWAINASQQNFEDILFAQAIVKDPQILAAQMNLKLLEERLQEKLEEPKAPVFKYSVNRFDVDAKSALSLFVDKKGNTKVLFSKSDSLRLPIASTAKLMTAAVVLEYYDLNLVIEVSENAAIQTGNGEGNIMASERFTVNDLLYPLLIESNNTAALALAEAIGEKNFVALMNLKARELGLINTYFVNPIGLDDVPINYSTSQDLAKLVQYLLKEPLIWEIASIPELNFYSSIDTIFKYTISNTNELLTKIPDIIGGKTGWTPRSRGCLVMALEAPNNKGYIINVILGAEDNFGEMERLINWTKISFNW